MLKKIFNIFGYTFTRHHKSISIDEIIKLRLKYNKIDILLDVGANKGEFSEQFSNYFEECHLFEPNPELIYHLKNKFISNKYKILNLGCGKKSENLFLNITADKGKTLSSVKSQTKALKYNFRNTKVVKKVKIKIITLKEYLKNLDLKNKKKFLKIDTQGNDFETLLGLGDEISKIKFLKIEMPNIKLYNTSYDHWDILNFLKKNKFQPVFFENISRKKNGELIEYDVFFEKLEIN